MELILLLLFIEYDEYIIDESNVNQLIFIKSKRT